MLREFAVAVLAAWPFIPIFLVQIHLWPRFWRRFGALTYVVLILEWVPVALLIVSIQDLLLGTSLELGELYWSSFIFMSAGVLLHIWTGKLLGLRGLMGFREFKAQNGSQKLIREGPFSVVRHPTYFAHTLMFLGVFLMTGFLGTGILVLIDLLTVYFVIIPLEEKELLTRFGEEYRRYMENVPKFLPQVTVNRRK